MFYGNVRSPQMFCSCDELDQLSGIAGAYSAAASLSWHNVLADCLSAALPGQVNEQSLWIWHRVWIKGDSRSWNAQKRSCSFDVCQEPCLDGPYCNAKYHMPGWRSKHFLHKWRGTFCVLIKINDSQPRSEMGSLVVVWEEFEQCPFAVLAIYVSTAQPYVIEQSAHYGFVCDTLDEYVDPGHIICRHANPKKKAVQRRRAVYAG
jgi:hypothetical protein